MLRFAAASWLSIVIASISSFGGGAEDSGCFTSIMNFIVFSPLSFCYGSWTVVA
jgi:hypothetical protein